MGAPEFWCPGTKTLVPPMFLTVQKVNRENKQGLFCETKPLQKCSAIGGRVFFLSFALLEQEPFPYDLLLKVFFLFTIYSGSSCTERCPGDLRGREFFFIHTVYFPQSLNELNGSCQRFK